MYRPTLSGKMVRSITGAGNVTILDRKRLERASCECYLTVKIEYDRYMQM